LSKPAGKSAPPKSSPAAKAAAPAPAAKKGAPAPAAKVPAKAPPPPAAAKALKPTPAPATPAKSPSPKVAAAPAPASASAGHSFADRFGPAKANPPALREPPPKPAAQVDPRLANAWKTKAGRDLTEAELLAMPDSEYMNDKQIEYFRLQLQAQKDDLLSNAGETTEHLREDTTIVPDPADRATIEEEHALELRTRDRERKLLKKISQALSRLESGEYGYCDETGEPIGLARLLARPTATLSLEAQQRRELKQKMFGD